MCEHSPCRPIVFDGSRLCGGVDPECQPGNNDTARIGDLSPRTPSPFSCPTAWAFACRPQRSSAYASDRIVPSRRATRAVPRAVRVASDTTENRKGEPSLPTTGTYRARCRPVHAPTRDPSSRTHAAGDVRPHRIAVHRHVRPTRAGRRPASVEPDRHLVTATVRETVCMASTIRNILRFHR